MKRWIHAVTETDDLDLASNALLAKEGDQIYDNLKDRIGTVVKTGQSGNYDILYVDFNDGSKILRINPMDDAQRKGRFFKIESSTNVKAATKYQCYYNETIYVEQPDGSSRPYIGKKVLDKVFDTEEEADRYCEHHVGVQKIGDEWIDNEMHYEEIDASTEVKGRGRRALEQFKKEYPKAYKVLGE